MNISEGIFNRLFEFIKAFIIGLAINFDINGSFYHYIGVITNDTDVCNLAILVAFESIRLMDHQVAVKIQSIQYHADRINHKWHVCIEQFNDCMLTLPTMLFDIGVRDANQATLRRHRLLTEVP